MLGALLEVAAAKSIPGCAARSGLAKGSTVPMASNQPGCCCFTCVIEVDPRSGGGAAITGGGVLGGRSLLGAVRIRPDGAEVFTGSVYLVLVYGADRSGEEGAVLGISCDCEGRSGDDGVVLGTGMAAAAAFAAAAVIGL